MFGLGDDNYEGGLSPSPELGHVLVNAPHLIAAHLASKGIPPPADVPDDITLQDVHTSLGKALKGGIGDNYEGGGPSTPSTPSQQGAAESPPIPRPRPTPSPESPNSSGAVPAKDTSKSPSNSIDDLGKALAGLHPMAGPPENRISTPQAYHPSNMISRSNLPSVLLQQLSGITKGTTGPYRLGQALMGVKNA